MQDWDNNSQQFSPYDNRDGRNETNPGRGDPEDPGEDRPVLSAQVAEQGGSKVCLDIDIMVKQEMR